MKVKDRMRFWVKSHSHGMELPGTAFWLMAPIQASIRLE